MLNKEPKPYYIEKHGDKTQINVTSFPTLYKYQSVNEHSVKALLNCELWGTVPTNFNDPFDMIYCFSKSKIVKAISDMLTPQRCKNYSIMFGLKTQKELAEYFAQEYLDKYNDDFRKNYVVSCFSEIFDSPIMWGHYCNSSKGFVLAYDSKELFDNTMRYNHDYYEQVKSLNPFNLDYSKIENVEEINTLAPVLYTGEKFNVSDIIIKSVNNLFEYLDDFFAGATIGEAISVLYDKMTQEYYTNQNAGNHIFYSALCNKDKEWKYEKEWRVWGYNSNLLSGQMFNPYMKFDFHIAPKAIYLGEFISKYDEIALTKIAKEKLDIPVYNMYTKMYNSKCKLLAKQI